MPGGCARTLGRIKKRSCHVRFFLDLLAHSPITYITYGKAAAQPDILLWCPHACDGQQFLETFPEFLSLCRAEASLIGRYLRLEYDFGSEALSRKTAECLAALQPDCTIVLAISNIPRGLIDPARIPNCALRNIYTDRHHPLLKTLQQLQCQSVQAIQTLCNSLSPQHGFFLDIHTMAPFSPIGTESPKTEVLREQEHQLESYINAYQQATGHGVRRHLDLITSEHKGQWYADYQLTNIFIEELRKNKIAFELNQPYSAGEHLLGTTLMRARRGLTLDMPKDHLSKELVEAKDFDLTALTVDAEKVKRYASIYACALSIAYRNAQPAAAQTQMEKL